jgi:hypothetical protein
VHSALNCFAVGELAGDDREVGVGDVQLARAADVSGDVLAGVECLGDDLAADAAGGAEDREVHRPVSPVV